MQAPGSTTTASRAERAVDLVQPTRTNVRKCLSARRYPSGWWGEARPGGRGPDEPRPGDSRSRLPSSEVDDEPGGEGDAGVEDRHGQKHPQQCSRSHPLAPPETAQQ